MERIDTGFSLDSFRLSRREHKTDYKRKLARESVPRSALDDVTVAEAPSPLADAVKALVGHPEVESVAFQCVAVAALQTLDRARYREQQAAEAALSLAQRQKLDAMIEAVEAAAGALRAVLNAQGAKLRDRNTLPPPADAPERSWWFALREAIQALDEGGVLLCSLAAGQPEGGPTRRLSGAVAHLLHQHHRDLLAEAEPWLG